MEDRLGAEYRLQSHTRGEPDELTREGDGEIRGSVDRASPHGCVERSQQNADYGRVYAEEGRAYELFTAQEPVKGDEPDYQEEGGRVEGQKGDEPSEYSARPADGDRPQLGEGYVRVWRNVCLTLTNILPDVGTNHA